MTPQTNQTSSPPAPPLPAWSSPARAALLGLLAVALVGGGCDAHSRGGTYAVDQTRQLSAPRPSNNGPVPDAERFGFRRSKRPAQAARSAPLAWTLPPGWTEKPPRQFREGNFAIDARPAIQDCFLTILPGANAGGGVAANVNRWRGQMSVEDLDLPTIAKLPTIGLLGVPATFVEIEGTYTGMRGDSADANWKMVGVFADIGGAAVSIKMVGPVADVNAEIANLRSFCASVRQAEQDGHEGHNHGSDATGGDAPKSSSGGGLQYDVPSGWAQGPAKQMRMVTFLPEGTADAPPWECYVASAGGSLEANLNRWVGQVGRASLTAEEIANLPKIDVMGRASPLLDVTGTVGASDESKGVDFRLLGVVCELPQQTLFVKMVGRADQMSDELERFKSFCQSLRL